MFMSLTLRCTVFQFGLGQELSTRLSSSPDSWKLGEKKKGNKTREKEVTAHICLCA